MEELGTSLGFSREAGSWGVWGRRTELGNLGEASIGMCLRESPRTGMSFVAFLLPSSHLGNAPFCFLLVLPPPPPSPASPTSPTPPHKIKGTKTHQRKAHTSKGHEE